MKFKKILYIFLWILVIACVVVLMTYSYKSQKGLRCKSYTINIDIEGDDTLLYKSDIVKILLMTNDSIIGKRFSQINLSQIEKELLKNIYVTEAEVFSDLNGNILLNVKQFTPIIRVVTTDRQSFYLNREGNKIPSKRPAYVTIANGNFETKENESFTDLLRCVELIQSDAFLKSQIGQIYLTEKGLYKLYPVIGNHEIILGTPENFEEGLKKLKLFYKKGIDKQGWESFQRIDVRFRDQVVCTKKN